MSILIDDTSIGAFDLIRESGRKTGQKFEGSMLEANHPLWENITFTDNDDLCEKGKRGTSVTGLIDDLRSQMSSTGVTKRRLPIQKTLQTLPGKPSASRVAVVKPVQKVIEQIELPVYEYVNKRPPIIFEKTEIVPDVGKDKDIATILTEFGFRSDRLSTGKATTAEGPYKVVELNELARRLGIRPAGLNKEKLVNAIKAKIGI